jgi:hypothetical protein
MALLTYEERKKKINTQLRMEIGAHYVNARGIDPSRKPGNTRNLVSAIIIASKLTGEFDELKPIFDECVGLCMNAEQLYKVGKWETSNYVCAHVLDHMGELVHGGYGQLIDDSFKYMDRGGEQ